MADGTSGSARRVVDAALLHLLAEARAAVTDRPLPLEELVVSMPHILREACRLILEDQMAGRPSASTEVALRILAGTVQALEEELEEVGAEPALHESRPQTEPGLNH